MNFKMKNFFGVSLLLLLNLSFLFGNDKTNLAVLFDKEKIQDKYASMLMDSIMSKLDYSKRMNFDYFTYDESTQEIEKISQGDIGFSKQMVAIDPNFYYEEKPRIDITFDKETKRYKGNIRLEFKIDLYLKLIDVATSKVDLIEHHIFDYQEKEMTDKNWVFDIQKYYKGTFPKKGTKAHQLMLDKIYKVYIPKMREFHKRCMLKEQKIHFSVRGSLFSSKDDRLFEISPVEGKSNMRSFMIDAGVDDDIFWLDNVRVIKQVQLGKYNCGEYLGTAVIKKRTNNESKCGFLLTGGKKLKNAVENDEKVYAVRNRALINTLNTENTEKIRVGSDSECLFCNVKTEKVVFNIENVDLIERSHGLMLNYFINRYKTEKFIDYDIENVLGLQEGVQYLMRSQSDNISLTEIKTNRVASIGKNYYINQFRQFMLDFFEQEMEVLEISKRKKDVAKRLIIYSPYGFEPLDVLNSYSVTEENVGGKVYYRKEKIGTVRVLKKYSDNIVEVSINKNEKLITKTLDSGGMISIGYATGVKK